MIFDYLEGGAEDELCLKHNRDVLRSMRFQPRRLTSVSKRDITTQLFGKRISAPLVIAPTGFNSAFWPDGDVALARAAAKEGVPFVLSTASSTSIEEVARQCDGDLWFQLYVLNRAAAEHLVRRALAAGYSTLVLTVDVAVNGFRERDLRNKFSLPIRLAPSMMLDGIRHPSWLLDLLRHGAPQLANFAGVDGGGLGVQSALMNRNMDAGFGWDGLAWLRQLWPRRLIVKGLTHVADSVNCITHGADGVILSNHGGRQLDGAVSPLEILSETMAQVSSPVLVDSGFRRGSDVVKALALGASAVLLGRATLYGLAASGEVGVQHVLRMLKSEIDLTLAQLGCASIDQLSPDHLLGGGNAVGANHYL